MKKLLNKLFERFGYITKEVALLNAGLQIMDIFQDKVKFSRGFYFIKYDIEGYWVEFDLIAEIPIKFFPFGDDKEYAKLCAEELCKKLNERI